MSYELVSIVLPIYRQAPHLDALIRSYEAVLAELPMAHEIVLVLNGPDDGSLAIARQLADEFGTVQPVELKEAGWGRAVQHGLAVASGDLICYTNSARTTAETLILLLRYATALPGIVIKANRKTRDSAWRHLGSLIYNLECRALFDLSNFDINGTPKVFPRSASHLLALRSMDDLIDAEFLATCRDEGYLILEVPIVVTKRHGGVSTTTARSAVRMYVGALSLRRRMRRGSGTQT